MENKLSTSPARQWHPLEYAHVFLWLIKDLCWAQGWKAAGTLMVFPTIVVAILITWLQRQQRFTLIHNLAISVWISSNSLWMLAEFYGMENNLKPVSTAGFLSGLLILLIAYTIIAIETFRNKKHQGSNER